MDVRLGRKLSGQPNWQALGRGPYRVPLRLASREAAALGQKVFPSDVGKVVGHARIVERSSNKVAAQIEPSQEGNLTTAKPALPVVEHRGSGSCGVARTCVVVSHQWANGRRLTGSFWDRDSIFQQFDG